MGELFLVPVALLVVVLLVNLARARREHDPAGSVDHFHRALTAMKPESDRPATRPAGDPAPEHTVDETDRRTQPAMGRPGVKSEAPPADTIGE